MESEENRYVLVANPGRDDQEVVGAFPSALMAFRAMGRRYMCSFRVERDDYDVMKLKDDGTLTTEF